MSSVYHVEGPLLGEDVQLYATMDPLAANVFASQANMLVGRLTSFLRDADRRIETLRRALAWHGDPARMAATREDWQQEIDAALNWVRHNPEPGRLSFPSIAPAFVAGQCLHSPDGRHQVDTSMEEGPNNCFHCGVSMATAAPEAPAHA